MQVSRGVSRLSELPLGVVCMHLCCPVVVTIVWFVCRSRLSRFGPFVLLSAVMGHLLTCYLLGGLYCPPLSFLPFPLFYRDQFFDGFVPLVCLGAFCLLCSDWHFVCVCVCVTVSWCSTCHCLHGVRVVIGLFWRSMCLELLA